MKTMMDVIDRAAGDPDFLAQLRKDPFGAAATEGYEVTRDDARALLGMRGASDQEVAEALQDRLSHAVLEFGK